MSASKIVVLCFLLIHLNKSNLDIYELGNQVMCSLHPQKSEKKRNNRLQNQGKNIAGKNTSVFILSASSD